MIWELLIMRFPSQMSGWVITVNCLVMYFETSHSIAYSTCVIQHQKYVFFYFLYFIYCHGFGFQFYFEGSLLLCHLLLYTSCLCSFPDIYLSLSAPRFVWVFFTSSFSDLFACLGWSLVLTLAGLTTPCSLYLINITDSTSSSQLHKRNIFFESTHNTLTSNWH